VRENDSALTNLFLSASRGTDQQRAVARKRLKGWGRYVSRYVRRGRAQARRVMGRR
jgi:hypothetical protein